MILGFIGTGKISSSIIFGIFKSKLKIKRIYISSRNRNIAKKLSKSYGKIKVLNNNQEIIDKSSAPISTPLRLPARILKCNLKS